MFDFLKLITWGLFRHAVVGSSGEADILALRHQVAVLRRQVGCRPKLTRWDHLFFAALYRVQPDVLRSISIVRPERWCVGTGQGSAFSGSINLEAEQGGHACRQMKDG